MSFEKGFIIGTWVGFGAAFILTVMRIWIRLAKLGNLLWDDATHLAALAILLGWSVMNTVYADVLTALLDIQTGQRPFTAEFFTYYAPTFLKFIFASQALSYGNLWLIKATFMILYKRFFKNLRGLTIAWRISAGYMIICYLVTWACALTVAKTPPDSFRIEVVGSAASTKKDKIYIWVHLFLDFTTDLCILFLPMALLWKLNVPWSQKLGLATMFSVGIFTMAVSILRSVLYYQQLSASHSFGYKKSVNIDPNWLQFWVILESITATCVSCMPSFRLLLKARERQRHAAAPAHQAQSSESYDKDGLAKLKNREKRADGHQGRPTARFIGGDGSSDSQSTLKRWLLRLTPSSRSRGSATQVSSFRRFIWPGRGRLGNRGSLHGPLDSISIPGATLITKHEPEKHAEAEQASHIESSKEASQIREEPHHAV